MEITELPSVPISITKDAIRDLEECKDREVLSILEKHFRKLTNKTRSVKLKGFKPAAKSTFCIKRIRAGSWRIVYTKHNQGEYLILKIGPRKDVYKDLKEKTFPKIYDLVQKDHIDLSSYLRKYHKYVPVLDESQDIPIRFQSHVSSANSTEICLFGAGNDFVISGGAGTGKSISASDLASNFLEECIRSSLPSKVVFLTPENLVNYFSKSPILSPLIQAGQMTLTTYRKWLLGILGLGLDHEVPEWLELGVLNVTGGGEFTSQDLVLYQLYVICGREILAKELTSSDHAKRIPALKAILPANYQENLRKYFAFYRTVRELTREIKTISIDNWNTLNRLYQYYITKKPAGEDASLNHIHFVLNKRGKNLSGEYQRQLQILGEFKATYGEAPSRIGYLRLAGKKLSTIKGALPQERILLVVDEAQDLLKDEMVLLCEYAQGLRNQGTNVNVRFFGDLCQRLYPTGFMWEQVGNLKGNIRYLDINYRNSNHILEVTNQLLKLQSQYISKNDARNFSNIRYKGTFDGEKPRFLVLENFQRAVAELRKINGLVFHQGRVNSLRKELSNSTPVLAMPPMASKGFQYGDFPNLLMLDIRNAKGMEFFGNVIFCPFLGKEINSQNFMEWYTIFSRTEERLFLILTEEERELLSKTGLSFEGFDEGKSLEDCVAWINEKNQVSLNGLDISLVNKLTGEALLNSHFYEDTYEVLEESEINIDDWETFFLGRLAETTVDIREYLAANVACTSFQCLLKRSDGRYWECCELASSIRNAIERERVIKNVFKDLHTKHMMPLEAQRISHFYLNENNLPFQEEFHGFKLKDPGQKFQPLDVYLPQALMGQIAIGLTERLAAHE